MQGPNVSSAKRRINSTGRKKISQDKIDLRILAAVPGEPMRARLGIDLKLLGLPASASVSVEAYHHSTAMRFDCGTVGAKKIPETFLLSELDQAGGVLSRIHCRSRNSAGQDSSRQRTACGRR